MAATTVVAADALYADAVTLGGLRRALDAVPADDRNVRVSTRAPAATLAERDAVARAALSDAMRTVSGDVVGQADVSWLEPTNDLRLSGLRSYEPLEEHAALVAGRWPEAGREPLEATLPAETADALGVEVDDRFEIADSRDPTSAIEVVITGTWRGEDSPLWEWVAARETPTEEGALGPLVIRRDDLARHAVGSVALQWWAVPDLEQLSVDGIDVLRGDVAALAARLRASAAGESYTVRTNLPVIVDQTARSVVVTRAGILALGAQFAILALYAVVLVASILVERRRTESALLRARGAGGGHLAAMALGEALVLAVPVALVAPWLASIVVRTLATLARSGDAGVLDASALGRMPLILSVATAALGVLGLTIGAVVFDRRSAGSHVDSGRPAARTVAQRLGIDLVLLAVAAIGIWQLRVYGAQLTRRAPGELGIDPLLVAAPAVGLLAGAVLATRFLPRAAELGERALTRLHGLVAPLAARTVARRPLRYTRSALLLMLAVALATFAALYNGTWERSQADQATYRAGADVRILDGSLPAAAGTYRSMAHVEAATPVQRDVVRVGSAVRDGVLLAIDPVTAQNVLPADTSANMGVLSSLVDERPPIATVPVDGQPDSLTVVLDVDLVNDPDAFNQDALAGVRGLRVAVLLLDADGRMVRFESPAGDEGLLQDGDDTRIDVPLTIGREAVMPQARLLGFEILVTAPAGMTLTGTIELAAVEWSGTGTSGGAVALDAAISDWQWDRVDVFGEMSHAADRSAPGRIVVGGRDVPAIRGLTSEATVFRLWAAPRVTEIPAVAGRPFLEQSGARVGDVIAVADVLPGLRLRIADAVDTFPTLDAAVPFVIVDGPTLELLGFAAHGEVVRADEWWLAVDDGREGDVLQALRADDPRIEVIGQEELAAQLANDPVALGVIRVLSLGSLAAMSFAGIAFLVAATVSLRERVGEFAVLRALGLSTRQLAAWLAMESAFLLGFGLLAGSAVGLALGWLVLPFTSFTQDGRSAVPAPVVVMPWGAIAPLYAVTAVLFIASVLIVRRQLPGVRITDVLRGTEN